MGLSYGFFNSMNGDRTYDAEEFSSFLDGIVYDGVYQAVGNKFYVEAYEGMKVTVDTGRAWFNHTWTLNTSKLMIELEDADSIYDRIDAIVLEVNKTDRRNYIKAIKGTPLDTPVRPSLIKGIYINQYPLAYITVHQNTNVISQSDITYMVDTDETPLCSALALAGIPSGGDVGMVLAKKTSESGVLGWYKVDRLPTEDWIHPTGVEDADIIAAYRFKGAENETIALTNINNGPSYILEKNGNITWSAGNGFFIPAASNAGFMNSSLKSQNMGTVAIKFANASTGKTMIGLIHKDGNYKLFLKYDGPRHYEPPEGTQFFGSYASENPILSWAHFPAKASSITPTDGVISCNFRDSRKMYYNGALVATSYDTVNSIYNCGASTVIGQPSSGNSFGSVYIHAVVIYNRILTDSEQIALHRLMIDAFGR